MGGRSEARNEAMTFELKMRERTASDAECSDDM